MDVVDRATRSRMMAGIRSKNTRPELQLRSILHRAGFRYRLHSSRLPGRPDLVLARFRAVILVHGCFWHGHSCPQFRWPKSNSEFWKVKISANKERDRRTVAQLMSLGWRVCVVWECVLRGRDGEANRILELVSAWLPSDREFLEIGK